MFLEALTSETRCSVAPAFHHSLNLLCFSGEWRQGTVSGWGRQTWIEAPDFDGGGACRNF